jgi:YrbI family 3-deoxy-D-manno-octulosonate 8-phosphate phosphatase
MFNHIFCDVDGVLTDGGYLIDHLGNVSKSFNTRDMHILSVLSQKGYKVFCITGSDDKCTLKKMEMMNLHLIQNCSDKKAYIKSMFIEKFSCSWDEILFIGDGINDIDCLCLAKYKACPLDSSPFVLNIDGINISNACGGHGCVEDIVYNLFNNNGINIL